MNNCSFLGRFTRDPECFTLPTSGSLGARFTLAVDKGYKDAQGNRQADFIPCIAYDKTATLITQYFKKGDMIGITGRLDTKPYEDTKGNKRTAYNIIVNNISFIGGKAESKAPDPKKEIKEEPKKDPTAPISEAKEETAAEKPTFEPNYELPDLGETDGLPFDI